MNLNKNKLIIIILLITNLFTFSYMLNKEKDINKYLIQDFSENLEMVASNLKELEVIVLKEDEHLNISKKLSDVSLQIHSHSKRIQNFHLLDNEFWYDFDYLILYIKKLSEKQTLSKDDLKNLSQLVSLGKKLHNSSKISESTNFLSKKYLPSEDIIQIINQLEKISQEALE